MSALWLACPQELSRVGAYPVREPEEEEGDGYEESHLPCCTLEGRCRDSGGEFFIQFHAGMLNFLHLKDPEKDRILGVILDAEGGMIPISVELDPGNYVTFWTGLLSPELVGQIVSALIEDYFMADEAAPYEIRTEDLGY